MAKITAHFAPSGDHARLVKITDRKRPNRAVAVRILRVKIADVDFAPEANRVANLRQGFLLVRVVFAARTDQQRRLIDACAQFSGQNALNFGKGLLGRERQLRITVFRHPAHTEQQSLGFLGGQSQRGQ